MQRATLQGRAVDPSRAPYRRGWRDWRDWLAARIGRRPEERLIRTQSLSKHLQRDLGLADVAPPIQSPGEDWHRG